MRLVEFYHKEILLSKKWMTDIEIKECRGLGVKEFLESWHEREIVVPKGEEIEMRIIE